MPFCNIAIESPRTWTYQERLLSPRRVYFTESEMFFTCGEMNCSEAYALHKRVLDSSGQASCKNQGGSSGKRWELLDRIISGKDLRSENYARAVMAYSKRDLTVPEDRLDGFTGIADKLDEKDMPTSLRPSLSGMPTHGFAEALLWNSHNADTRGARPERIVFNAVKIRYFPSWT